MGSDQRDRSGITVHPCVSLEDIHECVQLQRAIWNDPDPDLIPTSLFVVANKVGGGTLLARDGVRPIGFSLAVPGVRGGLPYLHSHIAGVLPEYQNRQIGRQIKIAQRALALADGIAMIEWTFDPLSVRNAYFNIVRLGAVVRSLYPNLYGITSSPLHGGLPTDRLVAEWHLSADRVRDALAGVSPTPAKDRVEICVPAEVELWKRSDQQRAFAFQFELRSKFQELFAQGYVVDGFRVEGGDGVYGLSLETERTPAAPQGR